MIFKWAEATYDRIHDGEGYDKPTHSNVYLNYSKNGNACYAVQADLDNDPDFGDEKWDPDDDEEKYDGYIGTRTVGIMTEVLSTRISDNKIVLRGLVSKNGESPEVRYWFLSDPKTLTDCQVDELYDNY